MFNNLLTCLSSITIKSIPKESWQAKGWCYIPIIRSTCSIINKIAGNWKKTTANDIIYYCYSPSDFWKLFIGSFRCGFSGTITHRY